MDNRKQQIKTKLEKKFKEKQEAEKVYGKWPPEKVKAFNEYKPAKAKTLDQIIAESTVDILKKLRGSITNKLLYVNPGAWNTSMIEQYNDGINTALKIVDRYIKKEQKKIK